MAIHADYYRGGIQDLPDDVPDGAWFQMRIDAIEFLSEPENLRMVVPLGTPSIELDAHDIFMWLLTNEDKNMKTEAVKSKTPYKGKKKVVSKQGIKSTVRSTKKTGKARNVAATHTFKKAYVPIDPPCRKCKDGVLTRRRWNTLLCTNNKCDYEELQ